MRENKTWKKGFTLIEMLIVIVVIAILAMTVIPRLMGATRKSKEANLKANLKSLRDSIEQFEANTAAWPPSLNDVVASSGATLSGDSDGRGISVDRSAYTGPYIVTGSGALPNDPFTGAADWNYNNATGEVHSASTLSSVNGTAYSTW